MDINHQTGRRAGTGIYFYGENSNLLNINRSEAREFDYCCSRIANQNCHNHMKVNDHHNFCMTNMAECCIDDRTILSRVNRSKLPLLLNFNSDVDAHRENMIYDHDTEIPRNGVSVLNDGGARHYCSDTDPFEHIFPLSPHICEQTDETDRIWVPHDWESVDTPPFVESSLQMRQNLQPEPLYKRMSQRVAIDAYAHDSRPQPYIDDFGPYQLGVNRSPSDYSVNKLHDNRKTTDSLNNGSFELHGSDALTMCNEEYLSYSDGRQFCRNLTAPAIMEKKSLTSVSAHTMSRSPSWSSTSSLFESVITGATEMDSDDPLRMMRASSGTRHVHQLVSEDENNRFSNATWSSEIEEMSSRFRALGFLSICALLLLQNSNNVEWIIQQILKPHQIVENSCGSTSKVEGAVNQSDEIFDDHNLFYVGPQENNVKNEVEQRNSAMNEMHFNNRCKPCAFFYNKGCRNGDTCAFCHHCDHSKLTLKQWKKQQQRLLRLGGSAEMC